MRRIMGEKKQLKCICLKKKSALCYLASSSVVVDNWERHNDMNLNITQGISNWEISQQPHCFFSKRYCNAKKTEVTFVR